ncbi:MAG: hypothetical protein E6Q32_08310 [Neisseriales bacterium]|nr:MAG: hypothetical protein E6Q32_08310 [Neisseriales bacterium]
MSKYIDVSNWFKYVEKYINTSINPYYKPEEFLSNAEEAIYSIPYSELKPLLDFKSGKLNGHIVLKGLDTDPVVIPTLESTDDIKSQKITFYSEFWLSVVAKILGDPIDYAQEKNGEIYQNVRPRKGQENKIASDSSQITLDLHVENGYHPIRPDFLMLYCLRQDQEKKGHTLALDVPSILHLLSNEEISILRTKRFKTSVDWNFGNYDAERGTGPLVSLIFGPENNPMIFWDDEYIIGVDKEAQDTLDKLRKILHNHMKGILLNPGEMIVYDNYRSVHGRTPFIARYDGSDRWLQRLLVVRDLTLNQKILNNDGRVLDWLYKPGINYSNIVY